MRQYRTPQIQMFRLCKPTDLITTSTHNMAVSETGAEQIYAW